NFFRVQPFIHAINDEEGIPLRAHISQAIGAAAAYCSFFKTDAKHIDLRKWQTELINFKARLFPWTNVTTESPHYMPLQKAYLDRKSTRLNSSHVKISYAVFCLKKKTPHTR